MTTQNSELQVQCCTRWAPW